MHPQEQNPSSHSEFDQDLSASPVASLQDPGQGPFSAPFEKPVIAITLPQQSNQSETFLAPVTEAKVSIGEQETSIKETIAKALTGSSATSFEVESEPSLLLILPPEIRSVIFS